MSPNPNYLDDLAKQGLIKKVTVKNNVAYDQHGNILPEKTTKGFKSTLYTEKPKYNASLFSSLTNTPLHFWNTLDNYNRSLVMDILETIREPLKQLRDDKLKAMYAKRAKRAGQLRWSKQKPSEE